MVKHDPISNQPGRRNFLYKTLSAAVVGLAAQTGLGLISAREVRAQTNLTPDSAFDELMAGNQRVAANQLTSIEHDLVILKEHTVEKQEPFDRSALVR